MKRQGGAHAMKMAASHVFIMLLAAAAPLCGVEAETQRKYVALMENVGNPNSASARRLFGKGVDAFNAARWEEAIDHFKNTAALDSFYRAGALYTVALLKDVAGEEEEARQLLEQTMRVGSPDTGAGGPAQYVGGGVEFAVYPMGGPSRARLGLQHARTGDWASALELFDSALAVDPDDITSRRNGIVALHELGREAEARLRSSLLPLS